MIENALTIAFWLLILWAVIKKKAKTKNSKDNGSDAKVLAESSSPPHKHETSGKHDSYNRKSLFNDTGSMPHKHKPTGSYDSYNRKSLFNNTGSMPHKHETRHYKSQADASNLPKGYILLNGEPVRVSDLENR